MPHKETNERSEMKFFTSHQKRKTMHVKVKKQQTAVTS